jgi:hypothetical protein
MGKIFWWAYNIAQKKTMGKIIWCAYNNPETICIVAAENSAT